MRAWLGLFGMGVLALASGGARAQEPGPVTVLKLQSRIVVLDVVVTDKRGRLVTTKLTQDDFTVFEDKKQQTIRNFDPPSGHAMPANVEVRSAADLRKIGSAPVTVLVLDALNTKFEDFAFVRQSMVKYLRTQPEVLREPTVMMIATNTRFKLMHDYTQDREALVAQVKAEPPEYPSKMMGGRGGPAAVERMAQTLASVEQIAQASMGTAGKKNVIWVGGGFPTADLVGLDETTAATIQAAVRRCTDMLMAARVTMFTIDPTPNGTSTVEVTSPEDATVAEVENGREPFEGTVAFQTLALATGGSAFASRNDIYQEIAQSIGAGTNYYTLSYTPTSDNLEAQKYRKIRVAMRDPNLRATTRNGYYPEAEKPISAEGPKQVRAQLGMEISSAVNSAISYNGLEVSAEKMEGGYRVSVGGDGLSWRPVDARVEQTEVTVMAAWFDGKGRLMGHQGKELTAQRKVGGMGVVVFSMPLKGVPGMPVRLRFVVRDAGDGRMGTVDLRF